MNKQDHTSPVRDITAWATSEDLPPQDLFSSIEDYRSFVRNWRALYREVSDRRRASRICGRSTTSLANPLTGAKRRVIRQAQYARYKPILAEPMSETLLALVSTHVPAYLLDLDPTTKMYGDRSAIMAGYLQPYRTDATKLLLIRQAGKRWVKQYHPWKAAKAA